MWRHAISQRVICPSSDKTHSPHQNRSVFFRWARQGDVRLWRWTISDKSMVVQGAWWLCVVWMKLSGKRVKGLGFFHRFSILLDGVALQNKNTHPDLQIICWKVANLYYLVLMMFAKRVYSFDCCTRTVLLHVAIPMSTAYSGWESVDIPCLQWSYQPFWTKAQSAPNLVGGFKHGFYFPFHLWDVIPTPLTNIFKMVETTNQ